MTKKIQLFTLALCLSLLGIVNSAKAAVTTYTYNGSGAPHLLASWDKNGVGGHPANFTSNSQVFQFKSGSPTMTAAWTVRGSTSGVLLSSGVAFSDGGFAFNVGVSGTPSTFTVSSGATATVAGSGTITAVSLSGTITVSGTASLGSTNISSGALLSVTGAATLSGLNPIAGTITISNASATVANINLQTGGIANINAAITISNIAISSGGTANFNAIATVAIMQVNSGGIANINANIVISSGLTAVCGSTVVFGAATAQTIFPTSYGNLTLTNASTNLGGAISVCNALTINAGCVLTLNQNALSIDGTIAGAGTITGDDLATISISDALGAGAIGTINFTAGHRVIEVFDMSTCVATSTLTLGTNLTITDGGDQNSLLDISAGNLNINGNTFVTDATCKNLNLGGTIIGSSTSLLQFNLASGATFNGGNLMMDQTTNGSSNALSNFTFNDGGNGITLPLGNNLDIIDSLSPQSGTIDAGAGNLILIADQTTVGHVGRIGMVTGAISGSINSQVFHFPSGNETNWVTLGSAGVMGTTFVDWDMHYKITCPTCPDGDGSAQNSGTPFTSLDAYNETLGAGDPNAAAHYVGINAITDPITIGNGFWVYMGTSQPGGVTPGELTTVTGTAQTGPFPWSLTNSGGGAATDGFNLLANPYPSPISWAKVAARNSNMITTYYSWNSVTQDYSIYNTATGCTMSGSYALTDVIPAGLAFYVQTLTGGTTAFNTDEGDKTAGNQIIGRMAQHPNSVQSIASYFSLMVDGGANASHQEATISFNPNSVAGIDGYDALAFPWNGVLQITTTSLGNTFAINSLPGLTQNYSIPVKILSGTTAQYTISTKNLQNIPAGACMKLHDNYGIMADQDIRGGAFTVTVNDTETVARFVLNVTISPLALTTNAVNSSCHAKNDGLITAVGNDAGPWNYIWKNASGTVVKTSLNVATADTLTGLNNGVYSVDVTTVGSCNSATQTFTITAPSSPVSAFTSSSQVNAGDNVVLTNNSTNASNYVWNFGDGDISSAQTPSYVYNNSGTYTITLQAINANCNDTASFTQVITVNAVASIKQANTGDGNINLSRDASGNYIQFDYTNQTKVSITVYNVLGQIVLNDGELSVVNDKIYINVTDNKNQVLYVSITNLNTNKQTTKKFVND